MSGFMKVFQILMLNNLKPLFSLKRLSIIYKYNFFKKFIISPELAFLDMEYLHMNNKCSNLPSVVEEFFCNLDICKSIDKFQCTFFPAWNNHKLGR